MHNKEKDWDHADLPEENPGEDLKPTLAELSNNLMEQLLTLQDMPFELKEDVADSITEYVRYNENILGQELEPVEIMVFIDMFAQGVAGIKNAQKLTERFIRRLFGAVESSSAKNHNESWKIIMDNLAQKFNNHEANETHCYALGILARYKVQLGKFPINELQVQLIVHTATEVLRSNNPSMMRAALYYFYGQNEAFQKTSVQVTFANDVIEIFIQAKKDLKRIGLHKPSIVQNLWSYINNYSQKINEHLQPEHINKILDILAATDSNTPDYVFEKQILKTLINVLGNQIKWKDEFVKHIITQINKGDSISPFYSEALGMLINHDVKLHDFAISQAQSILVIRSAIKVICGLPKDGLQKKLKEFFGANTYILKVITNNDLSAFQVVERQMLIDSFPKTVPEQLNVVDKLLKEYTKYQGKILQGAELIEVSTAIIYDIEENKKQIKEQFKRADTIKIYDLVVPIFNSKVEPRTVFQTNAILNALFVILGKPSSEASISENNWAKALSQHICTRIIHNYPSVSDIDTEALGLLVNYGVQINDFFMSSNQVAIIIKSAIRELESINREDRPAALRSFFGTNRSLLKSKANTALLLQEDERKILDTALENQTVASQNQNFVEEIFGQFSKYKDSSETKSNISSHLVAYVNNHEQAIREQLKPEHITNLFKLLIEIFEGKDHSLSDAVIKKLLLPYGDPKDKAPQEVVVVAIDCVSNIHKGDTVSDTHCSTLGCLAVYNLNTNPFNISPRQVAIVVRKAINELRVYLGNKGEIAAKLKRFFGTNPTFLDSYKNQYLQDLDTFESDILYAALGVKKPVIISQESIYLMFMKLDEAKPNTYEAEIIVRNIMFFLSDYNDQIARVLTMEDIRILLDDYILQKMTSIVFSYIVLDAIKIFFRAANKIPEGASTERQNWASTILDLLSTKAITTRGLIAATISLLSAYGVELKDFPISYPEVVFIIKEAINILYLSCPDKTPANLKKFFGTNKAFLNILNDQRVDNDLSDHNLGIVYEAFGMKEQLKIKRAIQSIKNPYNGTNELKTAFKLLAEQERNCGEPVTRRRLTLEIDGQVYSINVFGKIGKELGLKGIARLFIIDNKQSDISLYYSILIALINQYEFAKIQGPSEDAITIEKFITYGIETRLMHRSCRGFQLQNFTDFINLISSFIFYNENYDKLRTTYCIRHPESIDKVGALVQSSKELVAKMLNQAYNYKKISTKQQVICLSELVREFNSEPELQKGICTVINKGLKKEFELEDFINCSESLLMAIGALVMPTYSDYDKVLSLLIDFSAELKDNCEKIKQRYRALKAECLVTDDFVTTFAENRIGSTMAIG